MGHGWKEGGSVIVSDLRLGPLQYVRVGEPRAEPVALPVDDDAPEEDGALQRDGRDKGRHTRNKVLQGVSTLASHETLAQRAKMLRASQPLENSLYPFTHPHRDRHAEQDDEGCK